MNAKDSDKYSVSILGVKKIPTEYRREVFTDLYIYQQPTFCWTALYKLSQRRIQCNFLQWIAYNLYQRPLYFENNNDNMNVCRITVAVLNSTVWPIVLYRTSATSPE